MSLFVDESLGLEFIGGGGADELSEDDCLGGGLGGAPPGDELLLPNREPGEVNIAAAAATLPNPAPEELSSLCRFSQEAIAASWQ